ncbi:MEKHLA domain-containing protein [Terriglobus saanensis]|uniref:MEKHLA domain protein n=1 Tax=Terriglobus saanensis (strain ATCC BAA-1853 / DSM 23119 / SP1PR4) TaxID=401053 RepID=E8V4Q8_TERSS|nr:MEKHLA domain-containing protein [Terriglobus saanensis]ADV81462.1 MEKHLA domain protein [Terriglobus saanensis SP1PR4]
MDLRNDRVFYDLLAESFERLTHQPLVLQEISPDDAPRWLYEDAPFGILAHNTAADPVFVYGNKTAQKRFEYSWEELTALPSRLSAEAPERSERQRFLEEVQQHGFVANYRGIRIAKSGKRFWIEDAIVWQLTDADGVYRGQAAFLPRTLDV